MPSVFLSYSHRDEVWKERLQTRLGVLERQGLLETWDDRRIGAGTDWFEEIQEAMARASVAVLLISANFLTSKFILGEEVPRLLERRKREGLAMIPVLVRACAWDAVEWLRGIQARPRDDRALASFRGNRLDEELTKIAREIQVIFRQAGEVRADRDWEPRGPKDDFLDRVEAVCRLREPEAEIRQLPGIGAAGGYLRVGRRVGPFQQIYPVGAIEHGLSRELFQAFLDELDGPYRKSDPGLISFLIYGGSPAPADLVAEAHSRRVHLQSFVEYQGLIDFRTYLAGQTAKLAADPIYPPRLYVPQRMRTVSLVGPGEEETEDALAQVREWLATPHGRFLVLIGDFGTGKTFLLHELARRMGEKDAGLVPILLQMRSLEKGRSLDALLAQHFAQEKMEGFSPAKFRYMLEQGRIALLFDGFDEWALRVTYGKAADHFETLLSSDQKVRLWQVDSGVEIRALTGHQNWVRSVTFSPDGRTLASASDDNTIRFWQVDSGVEIRALTGHQNWVLSVAFSPDGKTLASASSDNTVRLWDVATGAWRFSSPSPKAGWRSLRTAGTNSAVCRPEGFGMPNGEISPRPRRA